MARIQIPPCPDVQDSDLVFICLFISFMYLVDKKVKKDKEKNR